MLAAAALGVGSLSAPLAASAATEGTQIDVPSAISVQADARKYADGRYIVTLKDLPATTYAGGISGLAATKPAKNRQIDASSTKVEKYSAYLEGKQQTLANKVGVDAIYNYTIAYNGFAAALTSTEAAQLSKSSAVASVVPDEILHVDAEKSTDYLDITGAGGTWDQVGGSASAGEGIVIGDLDTGIAPENPSFVGDELGTAVSATEPYLDGNDIVFEKSDGGTFRSTRVGGVQWSNDAYSTKIIGGQYFGEGFGQQNMGTPQTGEYLSPRDGSGHGSHTASTAAGAVDVPVEISDIDFGEISGVAPAAKIAAYKVCWDGPDTTVLTDDGCATTDLLAGVDAAITDGVDVINFSIGGGSATSVYTTLDAAFLNAASAGIFVSASAGNSGPGSSTLDHAAPWETTVAATTIPDYEGTVTAGSAKYLGATITVVAPVTADLVDATTSVATGSTAANASLCGPNSLSAAVAGKIVLCDRGTFDRVAKSAEVARAGGIGMVLVNKTSGADDIDNDFHSVPSIHVHSEHNAALHTYAAGAGTVTLAAGNSTTDETPVPQLADFSSRGPALASGSDTLKPDISAPGVSILAAVANAAGAAPAFAFYSGTSMAAPHVTGLAAIYLGEHPNATPAEIKSAIMTTATSILDADANEVEDPFLQGAGEVHPLTYLNPGLVYLADESDWKSYVVGTGEASFPGVTGIDPSDLNSPSIAIGDLTKPQTVSREVTALEDGTYSGSISGIAGVTATVSPTTLDLEAGETAHFTVTFSRTTAAYDEWATGFLTWESTSGGNDVRSPIAIHPTSVIAPAAINGLGTSGTAEVDLTGGLNTDLDVSFAGLAKGEISPNEEDPTLPYTGIALKSAESAAYLHEVGAGAELARFDLQPTVIDSVTDLDLEVYYAADEEALNSGDWALVGESLTPRASESVSIVDPEPGFYITVDYFYVTPAAGVPFNDIAFVISPDTDIDKVSASPDPVAIKVAKRSTFTIAWNDLDPHATYLGVVHYGAFTPSTFLTIVASPAFLAPPVISGAPVVGGTVSVDTGTVNINPADLAFAVQWTADGTAIPGATSSSFTIPAALYGKSLGATVSAQIRSEEPAVATAAPVVVLGSDGSTAVTSVSPPTITGTPNVGQVLTASTGSWNLPADQLGFTYQWTSNGSAIASATAATYTLVSADVGKAIGVTVTAKSLSSSASGTAVALPVTAKAPDGSAVIVNTVAPTITGKALVGSELTASEGTWNVPSAQLGFTYQWTIDGDKVPAATGKTYTLPKSAAGSRVGVIVTATAGTNSVSAASAQVSAKATSRTTITIADSTITTKKKARVTVVVAASTSDAETGTVVVHYGSKSKSVTLHTADKGKVAVTLPKLKKGSYKVWAEYKGNASIAGDNSVKKTLKVRKA